MLSLGERWKSEAFDNGFVSLSLETRSQTKPSAEECGCGRGAEGVHTISSDS